jgi:hypothetical protein
VSARTTLVLLALLVVLGAAAFYVQGPGSPDRAREHGTVFPGLKAGDVTLIRATRSGAEVLLTREGGSWKLGPTKEPADAAAVEALLASLVEARVGSVVSTNAGKQSAAYETDAEKGIAVRLEGAGGKVLAAFTVGKRGPDFSSCYLHREGTSEVLLVSRDLRLDFSRPAESWREPPKKAESSGSGSPAPTNPPATKP